MTQSTGELVTEFEAFVGRMADAAGAYTVKAGVSIIPVDQVEFVVSSFAGRPMFYDIKLAFDGQTVAEVSCVDRAFSVLNNAGDIEREGKAAEGYATHVMEELSELEFSGRLVPQPVIANA